MKKLLIIALLFVGCNRYEPVKTNALPPQRFDKWKGEYQYEFKGKWLTKEEFQNRYN